MKNKKRILFLFSVLVFSLSFRTVSALDDETVLSFDDYYTIEDAQNDHKDFTNPKESKITNDAVQTAVKRLEQLNKTKAGGYTWQLTKMTKVRDYGFLKGNYFKKVPAGTTVSNSVTANFSIAGSIKGITLTGGASFSVSVAYNGPSGTEAVGSSKATHRLYSALSYGTIMKYDYVYKDNYTGNIQSTKSENIVIDKYAENYSNLTFIDRNGKLTIRGAGSTKVKYYTNESDFRSQVNSEWGDTAVEF